MRVIGLISILFLSILGCFFYQNYQWYKSQEQIMHAMHKEIEELNSQKTLNAPQMISEAGSIKKWSDIQAKTRDTVVQIFNYGAQFNWLEPYKTPQQFQATGSGLFIDEEGHILTNAHVINETKALYIQIPSMGKRRFAVKILGVSPERDLALLQLAPEELEILKKELGKLPFLTLGNSDSVMRADEIMTLGYPLGQQSLKSTTGVVSGREQIEVRSLIQISAAINPGSSGGPSLNAMGEVIGITVAGITNAQNVGYIIPSNEVALFLKQLHHMPEVADVKLLRKPFLGVIFNNANEHMTDFLKNPQPGGLYVVEIYKGSPLHKAGVQPGDMIYEIDGYRLDVFGEMNVAWSEDKVSFVDYVSRLMLGETVKLTIYRKGVQKKLSFIFNQSEVAPVRIKYPAYEQLEYEVLGGLVFMPLAINHLPLLLQTTPELTYYMELKNQMEPALIITHVFPDSAAARSRAMAMGAIIKEINGEKVKNLSELRNALQKSLDNDFLTIKTRENVFTVLSLSEILAEEPKLASQYFYRISPFVQELIDRTASARSK